MRYEEALVRVNGGACGDAGAAGDGAGGVYVCEVDVEEPSLRVEVGKRDGSRWVVGIISQVSISGVSCNLIWGVVVV